jgi:hypothetical protein
MKIWLWYASPNIIKVIKSRKVRWAWHVALLGNAYSILVGKHEGNRQLGRPSCRWEDNVRMGLKEIGWGGVDWMDLAQDRGQWWAVVNTVMNLWVP